MSGENGDGMEGEEKGKGRAEREGIFYCLPVLLIVAEMVSECGRHGAV